MTPPEQAIKQALRAAVLLTALWSALALAPAAAQKQQSSAPPRIDDATNSALYAECLALARTKPEEALERAAAWEKTGGGDGAKHCAAIALLSDGRYAEAAVRLEALAAAASRASLRAELHAQAGQAWLIAGQPEKALAAQTLALETGGPRLEYLLDRAVTQASLGHYFDAIDDLTAVLDADPERTEALVMRATAWRKLRHHDLAADDVGRALVLAPDDADALLERGILRLLRGDRTGAVADWRAVVEKAPESIAAQSARENLRRDAEAGPDPRK